MELLHEKKFYKLELAQVGMNKLAKIAKVEGEKSTNWKTVSAIRENIFCLIFCGLECVGHSFSYVAYFVFLRDVF
jgi:hypothetical protein